MSIGRDRSPCCGAEVTLGLEGPLCRACRRPVPKENLPAAAAPADPKGQAVLGLLRAGLWPIPNWWPVAGGCACKDGSACGKPGKHPCIRWSDYQHRVPTETEVREWLARFPQANWGLVLGAAPGTIAVDFDGEGAELLLVERGIELPESATCLSHRGAKVLLKHPGGRLDRKIALLERDGSAVDLLGDGSQVVVPPSRHAKGQDYTWALGLEAGIAAAPAGLLELARTASRENGGAGKERDGDGGRILEHHRNKTLTSLAGSMRRRGMEEPEILAALLQVNARRCDPPLSETEVRGVAASVAGYVPGEEKARPEEREAGPAGKIGVFSLEELMATQFPQRRAHVGRGILPAQGKALLTGHGGVGKTVLLLQTALELAAGRAWLGRWLGDGPSRVGLLLQEDPPEVTQGRFRGLLSALALEARAGLPVFLNDPARYLSATSDSDLAWIIAFVKERTLDLLIPDPLITFHRENENDNARMRYVLDRLSAVQAETGCALLLAHHHRKSPEGGEDLDAARGARAIQDWARTVINLTSKGKVDGRDRIRLTFTKLNYGPMPPGPITLERDPATLLVRVVEEEEMCSPERAAQALEGLGGSAERKADWYAAIQKATGCADRTAREAGAEAIKRGMVEQGEKTRGGQRVRLAEGVSFGCGN